MFNRAVMIGIALVAVAAVTMSMGICLQPPTNPGPDAARAARTKHEQKAKAIGLMHAGDLRSARATFQRMVDQPDSDTERVEGLRLLSQTYEIEGDADQAERMLSAAEAVYTATVRLQTDRPTLRGTLLMDRAQLMWRVHHDMSGAVQLYDQVARSGTDAHVRDRRIAAQNAAVLCADLGRRREAVRRVDDLLGSSLGALIPTDEVVGLRMSQVSWLRDDGNLDEAYARCKRVWVEYSDRDEIDVLDAGIQASRWCPAVPEHCAERLAILRAVIQKIDNLRVAVRAGTADAAALTDHVREARAAVDDSGACADETFTAWAHQRLNAW
jgi:hypothetical protein